MTTIPIKRLSIDFLKLAVEKHSCLCVENQGGELFQHPASDEVPENSLLIDAQSAKVLCLCYDGLNDTNKSKFNHILQDEYKFASLLDKMWDWVRLKH